MPVAQYQPRSFYIVFNGVSQKVYDAAQKKKSSKKSLRELEREIKNSIDQAKSALDAHNAQGFMNADFIHVVRSRASAVMPFMQVAGLDEDYIADVLKNADIPFDYVEPVMSTHPAALARGPEPHS